MDANGGIVKTITLALSALLAAASALAQGEQFAVRTSEAGIEVQRNLAYSEAGKELRFDLYRPKGKDVVPVVIFTNVGPAPYDTWPIYIGWARTMANAGFAGVLYRARENKGIDDFNALVEDLHRRASELAIDPERIVIYGASSNVTIAMPLAMDATRSYLRGALIVYGVGEAVSIRTDLPVYFVRAGLDSPGLNSRIDEMLTRAVQSNAPWTIENYGAGYHGFEVLNDNDVSRSIIGRMTGFVRDVTEPARARAYADSAAAATAGAAYARGDWPRVVDYYQSIPAAQRDGETHLRLGNALTAMKRYREALAELEEAWQLGRRGTRDTALPASRAAAGAEDLPRTLHWLEILLSSRFGPEVEEIRNDALYQPFLVEPQFNDFLRGMTEERRAALLIRNGQTREAMITIKNSVDPWMKQERVVSRLAYAMLAFGKTAEAADLFRLNVARYPRSANAHDSLSEATEALNQKEDAIKHARRALALLPNDRSLTPETRTGIETAARSRLQRLTSPAR
jgi:tetratricopeptide (TPR) repeat protein